MERFCSGAAVWPPAQSIERGTVMVIRYASDTSPAAPGGWSPRVSAPGPFVGPSVGERISGAVLAGLVRLRRRLLPMICVAAIPLAGALMIQKLQPPRFETAATVFIDPNGGRPGRADAQADPAVLTMQLRLATSRAILQKAIETEKLVQDSSLFTRPTGLAALAQTALSLVKGSAAAPVEDRPAAILRMMSENIVARRADGTNLVEIAAVASDAASAARLANAVAQTFVDEIVLTADKAQGSDRARLIARTDDLKARLREAETKLAQFRVQNGLEPAGARQGTGDQDLASQLAKARAATIDARSRSDQIQKLLAGGKDIEAIADLVRSPSIERLRIQYNEAAAQEASFRTSLGPKHPAYLEAAEQAREKRRLLLEGLRLAASGAKADAQAARDLEAALEKRLGVDASAVMPAAPPAQMRELEREVEIARLAYERQMRLVDTADGPDQSGIARIVARAAVPSQATDAAASGIWKMAGLAASVLALVVLLFGGKATKKPVSARMAKKKATKPVAAAVTQAAPDPADTGMVGPAPARDRRADTPPLAPEREPDMIAHELAERGEEFALQTILVTASMAGLDKTGAALDLARAAARLDVRVLLIEACEHDPALTGRYASGETAGVITLQGRDRVIVAAELAPGLRAWVIPSEGVRSVPANDTDLRRYPAIAGHFDLVIMDGPVMSGGLAERKLARAAQTVVVVVPGQASPSQGWIATQLGIAADSIRVIPAAASPAPVLMPEPQPERVARPMSVVRLQKCA